MDKLFPLCQRSWDSVKLSGLASLILWGRLSPTTAIIILLPPGAGLRVRQLFFSILQYCSKIVENHALRQVDQLKPVNSLSSFTEVQIKLPVFLKNIIWPEQELWTWCWYSWVSDLFCVGSNGLPGLKNSWIAQTEQTFIYIYNFKLLNWLFKIIRLQIKCMFGISFFHPHFWEMLFRTNWTNKGNPISASCLFWEPQRESHDLSKKMQKMQF